MNHPFDLRGERIFCLFALKTVCALKFSCVQNEGWGGKSWQRITVRPYVPFRMSFGQEKARKTCANGGKFRALLCLWLCRGGVDSPLFTARSPCLEPLRRASCGLARSKPSGSPPTNPLPRMCRTTTQGPELYAMPNIQDSVAAAHRFQLLHHTLLVFVRASWASWTIQYFQYVVAAQFGFAFPGKLGTLLAA